MIDKNLKMYEHLKLIEITIKKPLKINLEAHFYLKSCDYLTTNFSTISLLDEFIFTK